mgnify:CR=1 FL=1
MIRAAMVGLGWWGRLMVDSVQAKSEVLTFTHGFVRNPDRARAYAQSRGLALAESFEALLANDDVDAIFLATPHSAHVPQIMACAAAGKPVYSEKPLALNLAEAGKAIDACAQAGVLLGLGTDRRALPAMKRLATLVLEGCLGTLLHVEAQYSNDNMSAGVSGDWRQNASETPGAGMTGPGLHVLDALTMLAGPLASVSGQKTHPFGTNTPIDTVALNLSFASGISGLLGVVRGVPNYFRIAVFGTEGWAELRDFGELHIAQKGKHPVCEQYSRDLTIGPLMEDFARALQGGPSFPVTSQDMLHPVAGFEACLTALDSAGWHTVAQQKVDAA